MKKVLVVVLAVALALTGKSQTWLYMDASSNAINVQDSASQIAEMGTFIIANEEYAPTAMLFVRKLTVDIFGAYAPDSIGRFFTETRGQRVFGTRNAQNQVEFLLMDTLPIWGNFGSAQAYTIFAEVSNPGSIGTRILKENVSSSIEGYNLVTGARTSISLWNAPKVYRGRLSVMRNHPVDLAIINANMLNDSTISAVIINNGSEKFSGTVKNTVSGLGNVFTNLNLNSGEMDTVLISIYALRFKSSVTLIINADSALIETSRANNTLSFTKTVANVDLKSGYATADTAGNVMVVIRNAGSDDYRGSFTVRLSRRNNGSEKYFTNYYNLPAGGSDTISMVYGFHEKNYYNLHIDCTNLVAETSEYNNSCIFVSPKDTAYVDLEIVSVDTTNGTLVIRNNGPDNYNGFFNLITTRENYNIFSQVDDYNVEYGRGDTLFVGQLDTIRVWIPTSTGCINVAINGTIDGWDYHRNYNEIITFDLNRSNDFWNSCDTTPTPAPAPLREVTESYSMNHMRDSMFRVMLIEDDNAKKATKIEENVATIAINVYPNPTTDMINISGDGSAIEIYNNNGQLLSKIAKANEIETISLLSLNPGLYIVRVLDSNGNPIADKKVIKK